MRETPRRHRLGGLDRIGFRQRHTAIANVGKRILDVRIALHFQAVAPRAHVASRDGIFPSFSPFAMIVSGSIRGDEPVSCVILIKSEQFGVAALPLAAYQVPP